MTDLLLLMIFAHFLADYPLQGDFIARAKNRRNPIPGVPFWHPLTAHAVIHGGMVGLLTGITWLAVAETFIHWITDDAKCRGCISYNTDQSIHVGCKVAWAIFATMVIGDKP